MTRRLLIPAAATLVGLAAGVILVSVLAPPAPESLRTPVGPRTLGLRDTEFRDERTIGLNPETDRAAAVALNTSGVVTASGCVPGAAIESGSVIARIDAEPIVSIASSTPLFRDLALDDEGSDVLALREALRALGFDLDAEGPYGPAVRDAVREVQQRTGITPADGTLRLTSIAWLPARPVVASSCEVVVGERYERGSPFAEVPGTIRSLTLVTGETTALVPGNRVVRLGSQEFEVPEDGVIVDPAILEAVAGSTEYRANAAKTKESPLSVSSRLVTPLRVVAVPPGAIVGGAADTRCVQLPSGATAAVRVVTERLGSSYVTFNGDTVPARIRIGAAVTAKTCG